MGRIAAWDELSLFGIWDELSLGTNRRLGRIVAQPNFTGGGNGKTQKIIAVFCVYRVRCDTDKNYHSLYYVIIILKLDKVHV